MIISDITEKVGTYLKDKEVNLSELSRKSGIPYRLLYASIGDKDRIRELSANEFVSICLVLGVNPMDFADKPEEEVV